MSNSSRIEQATRQHVNAVLTNDQIIELVKVTSPDWKGGVYPSDAAGKRLEDGTITHRGKVAYRRLGTALREQELFQSLADGTDCPSSSRTKESESRFCSGRYACPDISANTRSS